MLLDQTRQHLPFSRKRVADSLGVDDGNNFRIKNNVPCLKDVLDTTVEGWI